MNAETIQHAASLTVSTIISINVMCNYLYNISFDLSIPFIILYFGVDIFYCSLEFKLHHLCCLLLTYYKITTTFQNNNDWIPVARAINLTEVSTIFFCLKYFIKDTFLELPNNTLFLLTFFYFRIYNYFLVMSNPDNFTYMNTTNNKYALYIATYGLLTLNIYWATILLKILMKQCLKFIYLVDARHVINQESPDFLVRTYILAGIPILIDVSLCHYYSLPCLHFPLVALHIFQACLLKINPFYNHTHLVFYSTLYIQTILLCLFNLK